MSFCKVYYSQLIPSVNTLTPKRVISLQSVISIKKFPSPASPQKRGHAPGSVHLWMQRQTKNQVSLL